MSADQIKAEIKRDFKGSPIADVCLQLVEFVEGLPAGQAEMLTFRTFVRALGKMKVDEELLAAVTLLTSSNLAALDMHGMFIDDDHEEYELSAEDLIEARETGEFSHPHTGEPVENFQSKLIPFFTPSARFSEIQHDG